jgi:protein-disulfide isomerase
MEAEHILLAKVSRLRLSGMSRILRAVFCVTFAGAVSLPLAAQISMPPNQVNLKGDTSILKPPPGQKIAVLEWEDLECPACAHAFPIVHTAIKQYGIPLVRRDFQIPGHQWSHEASLYARYLEDKVAPDVATDYRRQVFASQFRIASKDDLNRFTQQFFAAHGKQIPFVLDPTGQLEKEVTADRDLGMRIGLNETPTIVVATNKGWIQVRDVMDLDAAIDKAKQMVATEPAPRRGK